MADAPTKTLYHGALSKLGPTTVKVVEEEKESTKKKGSFYVTLEIDGVTRYYTSENEACGRAFAGMKGKIITIQAEGGREDGTITIVGAPASQLENNRRAAAPPIPPNAGRGPQPPRATTPPEVKPQPPAPEAPAEFDPVHNAKLIIGRNRSLAVLALQAMEFTVREFEAAHREMPPELQAVLYTSLLYGCSAKGAEAKLPTSGVKFTSFVPVPATAAVEGGAK